MTTDGLPEAWDTMQDYRHSMIEHGLFQEKRIGQHKVWMWNYIQDNIMEIFKHHPDVKPHIAHIESEVVSGALSPGMAADMLLGMFRVQKPQY